MTRNLLLLLLLLSLEHFPVVRLVLERQANSNARVWNTHGYYWRNNHVVVVAVKLRDEGCAE
jgi:hypothetical protein